MEAKDSKASKHYVAEREELAMAKRGKTPVFATGRGKVEALKMVETGEAEKLSFYHRLQLQQMGLIAKEDGERRPGINRGRRPKIFKLTGKGAGLVNLSKSWNRKEA